MICFPLLPDKYYWDYHSDIYAAIYTEETDELIAWANLDDFLIYISREGSMQSYTQKGFASIQEAVDVMCTLVCLGMLYEGP